MKFRLYLSRSVGAALVALFSVLFGGASSFGASFALEGQNSGDTNTWSGGNLMGWQELQYIPCRFRIGSGPVNNLNVTLSFPGITASTPGFDGFFNFTTTPNVVFVSPPVLSAPASGAWSYSFTINVTDGNTATVNFLARLAAGAHANVGSALKISPDPSSAGELQIHKPAAGPGLPDLAIVKTGPTFVPQGGTITYTLTYTNKATTTNTATGVQVTDILPANVVVNPSTLPTNAALVGDTLEWDLPNIPPQTGGQFVFQAQVPLSTPVGTVVSNFVQILSAEDDANLLDNSSSWLTTVTNGCVLTATGPSDQAACTGGNATFMVAASGASLSYQWYQGSTLLSGQTSDTLTVTNVGAGKVGTYFVVVSDGCGNSKTNSANLTLNAPLKLTASPSNVTNCPGIPASFTVGATGTGLTYQWYNSTGPISGANGPTLNLGPASTTNAGTYSVVVSDVCNTEITNNAVLVVNQTVLVTAPPTNLTNCPGTTASFTVGATGTGLTYQWYNSTGPISGANGATLNLGAASTGNAGTYRVVVSDVCGNSQTNSAVLVVNQTVLVTSAPTSLTNCPGTPASFTVGATGTGLTYQWYNSTGPISGANGPTLNLGAASTGNAGTYRVVVSDVCGNSQTNSAVLVVNQTVLVTAPPTNLTNCPGTPASFTVGATGTGLTYQWYNSTGPISGANGATLNLGAASAANAGTYRVVVTDICGNSRTNSAVLVVNQPVLVTMPPSDQTDCPGITASFTVGATGTGLTYQWYNSTGPISGANGATLNLGAASTANAGTYSVVVSDICADKVTNSATLTVNTNVVVTIPPANSTNCPGTTASFSVTAAGTGLTYQWYENTNLIPNQTSNTLTLTNVTATNADTYSVVVSDTCGGEVSNSAVLVVNQTLSIIIPPGNVTACPGTPVSFTVSATGTGLTYQWYNSTGSILGANGPILNLGPASAAIADTYSVVVSDVCGDQVTNSATLTVNTDVLITIPPANSTNCPGTTASFSVAAIGTGLTYQWYESTNLIPNQTSNTLTLTNVMATNADTYSVVVGDACGDLVTNNAQLVVNQTVMVTAGPSDFTACPGTGAQFSVSATGTGLTYQWYHGAMQLPNQTANSLNLSSVGPADAGRYLVVVSDVCGDSVTNSANLNVNQNVLVTVPPSNSTNCPGTTANFSVTATGTGLTYQWYFGTTLLSTSNTLSLGSVSAANAGTYSVVISDTCGGVASNSAVLVVNQNVSVEPLASLTENIGNTVVFTAIASGTGPFTYQWYRGMVALGGQTNSTLTLTNVQPSDAGTYSVSVMGACTTAASVGAVLTINLPPVASIVYPTNGQVFVAPATFGVTAVASDPDGTVTNVEIFSSTNGLDFILLGETNNPPYVTVVSNLPVGTYTFKARATDNFGATGDSAPVTVSVVPAEGPTVTIVGSMRLNFQDGNLWLTNVVCNPEQSLLGAMEVFITGITNNTITVVNATGVTSNGVPFVETLGEIEPGQCWTNIIKFHDPTGVAFNPILTPQLLVGTGGQAPPPPPTGTSQPILVNKMLASGTFLLEFATVSKGVYFVQYKDHLADPWTTVPQTYIGSGQHMQWIDSGPPLTSSLPSTSTQRFYQVLLGN